VQQLDSELHRGKSVISRVDIEVRSWRMAQPHFPGHRRGCYARRMTDDEAALIENERKGLLAMLSAQA